MLISEYNPQNKYNDVLIISCLFFYTGFFLKFITETKLLFIWIKFKMVIYIGNVYFPNTYE